MNIPNPVVWMVKAIMWIYKAGQKVPQWVYEVFVIVLVVMGLIGVVM